jgi:hypothetical protein
LKDEQRKRRMRTLLPRFEKKAYLMVVEFRGVNGRNFEWDIEFCITGLAHAMLSEVEPKAIRARARKRSTQGKDHPAIRSRRRSENNRMS